MFSGWSVDICSHVIHKYLLHFTKIHNFILYKHAYQIRLKWAKMIAWGLFPFGCLNSQARDPNDRTASPHIGGMKHWRPEHQGPKWLGRPLFCPLSLPQLSLFFLNKSKTEVLQTAAHLNLNLENNQQDYQIIGLTGMLSIDRCHL